MTQAAIIGHVAALPTVFSVLMMFLLSYLLWINEPPRPGLGIRTARMLANPALRRKKVCFLLSIGGSDLSSGQPRRSTGHRTQGCRETRESRWRCDDRRAAGFEFLVGMLLAYFARVILIQSLCCRLCASRNSTIRL